MSHTQFVDGYKPKLNLRETQQAIKVIKDTFQYAFKRITGGSPSEMRKTNI